MRMSANEFLDITRRMSEAEYAEFVKYVSHETEEPEWLSEYREMGNDEHTDRCGRQAKTAKADSTREQEQ